MYMYPSLSLECYNYKFLAILWKGDDINQN